MVLQNLFSKKMPWVYALMFLNSHLVITARIIVKSHVQQYDSIVGWFT